ncbi:MAG: hypothetical protein HRT57_06790 [Crocinitomicaceae bacterium]|nr:hypothetical protein [Crocinitomicaceae bacterium]
MLIGEDFEKIQFDLFGLNLMDPNAFIGDTLIFIVALILARKVKNFGIDTPFFKNWYWFFIIFGTGFFVGGLGHLFYGYVELAGKYPPLYLGIISVVFIEKAMVSLLSKESIRNLLNRLIIIKLFVALFVATLVFIYADLSKDPTIALRVTSINATIGSAYALVYLGIKFAKSITPSFHYLWLAVVAMLPAAVVQSNKISFHQWFDRNDVSHVFLILSAIIYYLAILGLAGKIKTDIKSVS